MRQLGPGQYEIIPRRTIGKMQVFDLFTLLVQQMCIMGKERKEITGLKCRDCLHYKLTGWFDRCEINGFPVDKDGPACVSVLPKLSSRERRECMIKSNEKPRTH